MHLFYTPVIQGGIHLLEETESRHAIRVLRLGKGERVVLVDGRGGWYEAVIEEDHPKRCLLSIQSVKEDYHPMGYSLHLAVSPTKNMERFEWFLEKSTEIGISEITPVLCHRSERRQLKLERLERILISAMKQSLKAFKPILHNPVSFTGFIQQDRQGIRGIAACFGSNRVGIEQLGPGGPYTLMVGPEGDFTEEELNKAMEAGYVPFHLGDSRLRTETAGVYLAAAVSLVNSGHRQEKKEGP